MMVNDYVFYRTKLSPILIHSHILVLTLIRTGFKLLESTVTVYENKKLLNSTKIYNSATL